MDNQTINEFLKVAYRAVPKNVSLDGNILLEVHEEIGKMFDALRIDTKNTPPYVAIPLCEHQWKEHETNPNRKQCIKCKIFNYQSAGGMIRLGFKSRGRKILTW